MTRKNIEENRRDYTNLIFAIGMTMAIAALVFYARNGTGTPHVRLSSSVVDSLHICPGSRITPKPTSKHEDGKREKTQPQRNSQSHHNY